MKHRAIKTIAGVLICAATSIGGIWFADDSIAPLFLNSRIERLGENNLPKILVEKGGIIDCRMKADDFRFPLPPASHAGNLIVTGGFDTADGSVEVRFDGTNQNTAGQYEEWLSHNLQVGGQVSFQSIPGGLLIKFHYFGDR